MLSIRELSSSIGGDNNGYFNFELICLDDIIICPSKKCRPLVYKKNLHTCRNCVESDPINFTGKLTCECGRFKNMNGPIFSRSPTSWEGPCNDLRNVDSELRCFDSCPSGTCKSNGSTSVCTTCSRPLFLMLIAVKIVQIHANEAHIVKNVQIVRIMTI